MPSLNLVVPPRIRPLLAALLLLVGSACARSGPAFLAPSRPAQFSLAGIAWGIPADSVKALIEPRGYNYNRTDGDGDLWFDGVLLGAPTRIYALMADGKLVKFRVVVLTPDEDALTVYQNARAELVKQYGAPKETVTRYSAPYKAADDKELEAIKAGKRELRTYWLPAEGKRSSHIAVHVSDELTVVVDYEGPEWDRESVRRRTGR